MLSKLIRDGFFLFYLLAGVLFWCGIWWFDLLPQHQQSLSLSLRNIVLTGMLYPILEELAFRGALQSTLHRFAWGRAHRFGLSGANLTTSLLFTSFHLFVMPAPWALLVIFPSLAFGELRDRYQSTLPAMILHCYYNLGLMLLILDSSVDRSIL